MTVTPGLDVTDPAERIARRQFHELTVARTDQLCADAVAITFDVPPALACPACGSTSTERTAAFSGTACKDLYRCLACAEPFEHMKEI